MIILITTWHRFGKKEGKENKLNELNQDQNENIFPEGRALETAADSHRLQMKKKMIQTNLKMSNHN